MQYLCLIYSDENKGPQPGTPEFGPYIGGYMEFTKEIQDAGVLVAGDALVPVASATTVSLETGKVEVRDGRLQKQKNSLAAITSLNARI